jgi:hypothetical protein
MKKLNWVWWIVLGVIFGSWLMMSLDLWWRAK